MKFTDDTRFDLVESAESLSDLVMEKLISSGKFKLMETNPIEENIEIQLYDEKMRDLKFLESAVNESEINLTPLFEGVGFDEKRAQSIATAQVGQIIDPAITSAIGKAHNADYLIQGTIINLGTGTWWNEDFEKISDAMNMFSNLANSSVPLGMFGSVLSGVEVGKIGVGVQCDLRVIKAATGEVIWSKRVVGVHDQVNLNLGVASIGNRKLNNNFYAKAMDKAAQKIVDSLVADSKNIFQ
jgi:curli biogenesis system outer membrane secretion channel CsgG